MLAARGAEVVHVPLVRIADASDGGASLRRELDALDGYDWLVVTSVPGAERVGDAAQGGRVRLAAVGSATARVLAELAGRPVDLVPPIQRASALAQSLIEVAGHEPRRVLVAQGDLADDTLVRALAAAGHHVTAVEAYRTLLLRPTPAQVADADALALASGSAARAWVEAVGVGAPPVVVAIGPTTADVARELGLKVTGVAADHSLEGLVTELERHLGDPTS
jgi:uroporphyrinogen-III synthase